jgi:hypothetical protein
MYLDVSGCRSYSSFQKHCVRLEYPLRHYATKMFGELETTLAVNVAPKSPIIVILMMQEIRPPKHLLLQETASHPRRWHS